MIKESAIKAVFYNSLKLKSDEKCLIVTDTIKEEIARPFFDYASRICFRADIQVMEPLKEHGQEPPAPVAECMLNYDVELLMTNKSLSHTKARRDAKERGVRIASMPMITEDIINRCFDVDYEKVKEISLSLYSILKEAKKIQINTDLGTDITIARGMRKVYHGDGGIFDYKGAFGNLPEGEVSFAPENANGVYIVDASFPTFGKLDKPLKFDVSDGMVRQITGEKSKELVSLLDSIGPNAYIIAELGIGTNPKAKIIGNVLEDEKVLGTCHIAVGNNMSYGGNNNVPVHLDGVILAPTIFVDDKKIMDKGVPVGWV